MIYAYLIEDVRALSDLFKVGVGPKKSAHGQFTVFKVRHPEFNARRALIISGVGKKGLNTPLPSTVGREIKIDHVEGELFWYDHRSKKRPIEVFDFNSAPTLEALIEPVTWREEAEHDVSVVFWLHEPSLMPEIVRRSLYLNNDHIQISTFESNGQTEMLVRIEGPSYYLMAWCEEQPEGKIELFYPMTESPGLYVQWRYEHPLADLWRRAWTEHQDKWIFFPAKGDRRHMNKPEWTSIYELADFDVPLHDEQEWRQIANEVEHFEIALKLMPRHEPSQVEMLLLQQEDRHKLEDFLSLSDETDLEKLEISVQRDQEDRQWFFVREKHRSGGVMLVELGGMGYARYKGFDNLYLPVDLVLEPQLRRDQYRRLFELDPGTLTFLVPDPNTNVRDASSAMRVKVRKNSFEPLKHFVDHVVHFEREALESVLRDSVFDLETYKNAPSRPDLLRGREDREGGGNKKPTGPKNQGDRLQSRLKASKQRTKRKRANSEEENELPIFQTATSNEPATPTELELLETELERDLVRRGPYVDLWQDLMIVKNQRGKWLEATVSAVEGLWSLTFPDHDSEAPPEENLSASFKKGFIQASGQLGKDSPELAAVSELFTKLSDADDVAYIMQAAGSVRSIETRLGKKARWLAWREIFIQTEDVRTQEEVRESLLSELNAKGLDTLDTPTFLRERILKDPDLEFDDEDMDASDTSYVLQNVEVIEQVIENLQTTKIKEASRASLARIFAGMGLHARARDLIGRSLESMEQDLSKSSGGTNDDRAWHTRLIEFFRTSRASGDTSSRPERWHVWVALNAWLVYQRVDPARVEDAKQAYELLFNQLANYEKEELRKTAESLEARVGQTNIAEFLAQNTRSFFSSRALPDEMNKVVTGLRQYHRQGKEKQVNDLVIRGIELATRELNESSSPSLETVARLILEMVEILRKLKWEKEQRPVEQFEKFVKEMPREPNSPDASRLYFAVLHCAAVRAMMDLGREKEAMRMLVDIMRWVGQDYMQVLDFVDLIKKEVLLAIELAPRNQRNEALRWLMNTLLEQERLEIGDDPDNPGAGFTMPFQAYELIQMIDHTLEAAISNEKLVLRRLRDFEEREEYRIRYWVQRDQPASR